MVFPTLAALEVFNLSPVYVCLICRLRLQKTMLQWKSLYIYLPAWVQQSVGGASKILPGKSLMEELGAQVLVR